MLPFQLEESNLPKAQPVSRKSLMYLTARKTLKINEFGVNSVCLFMQIRAVSCSFMQKSATLYWMKKKRFTHRIAQNCIKLHEFAWKGIRKAVSSHGWEWRFMVSSKQWYCPYKFAIRFDLLPRSRIKSTIRLQLASTRYWLNIPLPLGLSAVIHYIASQKF